MSHNSATRQAVARGGMVFAAATLLISGVFPILTGAVGELLDECSAVDADRGCGGADRWVGRGGEAFEPGPAALLALSSAKRISGGGWLGVIGST